MQAITEKNMIKKRISVSGKRQITIPIEFFSQLGIDKEVECYVRNGSLIVRPATAEGGGEFAEQILADLIAQGLQGNELMERFKQVNRATRPAVEAMILQADDIASGKTASATMSDLFGEGE
ncbi:MAG: AbrB/MazE/SpoVT family DNA-binding domain-containing protein [Eubacteriales bacterium]|nr:AbrB/MazE/SpoVT family DNA-binding domain-containing protein [Eubacteriales bacterium]